jgi:glycerophosphoryl diester phosphodiesterase
MSRSGSQSAHDPAAIYIEPRPAVTAHAGSLGTPGNTLRSFQAALEHPVDWLEADVRFTPDRVPYLAHDPLPVPRQGKAMSLEALLGLAAAHPAVRLNLDLKELDGLREMRGLIERSGIGSRVLLTGVTAADVARVRGQADGLPYMLNARPSLWQRLTRAGAAGLIARIREYGACGLNVHHRFITRRLARALRAAGLSVSVWTVDTEREMRRVLALPVDNITTHRVDRLLAMRAEVAR